MDNPTLQLLRVELTYRPDLNYRIDLPSQTIRTLLTWPGPAEVNLEELRKCDQVSPGSRAECCMVLREGMQLRIAVRERKAFEDFKEADLTHLPYVLDTHLFDDTPLSGG